MHNPSTEKFDGFHVPTLNTHVSVLLLCRGSALECTETLCARWTAARAEPVRDALTNIALVRPKLRWTVRAP